MSPVLGAGWWIWPTALAVAYFVWREVRAFQDPKRFSTLSWAVTSLGLHWPLAIFFMGQFVGTLSGHFFWHWCPVGTNSVGSLEVPNFIVHGWGLIPPMGMKVAVILGLG